MNAYKEITAFFTSLLLVTLFLSTEVSAATVSLSGWSLFDSGKHLDWDGNTTYQSYFNSGVSTWNAYKSGVIRADSWNTICDVTISDFTESSSTYGVTSQAGTIRFNTFTMNSLSSNQKQYVCTHEIGHALGLGHNQSTDVMYGSLCSNTSLSLNDKASYDASYNS